MWHKFIFTIIVEKKWTSLLRCFIRLETSFFCSRDFSSWFSFLSLFSPWRLNFEFSFQITRSRPFQRSKCGLRFAIYCVISSSFYFLVSWKLKIRSGCLSLGAKVCSWRSKSIESFDEVKADMLFWCRRRKMFNPTTTTTTPTRTRQTQILYASRRG